MFIKRILGIVFIIAAVAGFILSVDGLIQLWRIKPAAGRALEENLTLLTQALDATDGALVTARNTLNTLKLEITTLQSTITALAKTLHDSGSSVTAISTLLGEDIPGMITATQTALDSAQSSAKLIDDILAALTSVPLSPMTPYKPEVPLATAFGNVSDSLDTLPESLSVIDSNLVLTQMNLVVLEGQLTALAGNIPAIIKNVDDAIAVITQYQAVVKALQERSTALLAVAPRWINTTGWILTIVLVWLMIAQLAMLTQGLDMFRKVI